MKKDKTKEIIEVLRQLPESKIDEVLDFVEYLQNKSERECSGIDRTSLQLQQESLKKIWDSPEEDLYEL